MGSGAVFGELAESNRISRSNQAAVPHGDCDEDGWPAGLAWRMGLAHYLRGEPRAALEVYARAAGGACANADCPPSFIAPTPSVAVLSRLRRA